MAESRYLGAIVRRSAVQRLQDGKNIELAALTLADWAFLQEEAAHAIKRDLIETYTRNADLLPDDIRRATILEAFKRAEDIRAETVPSEKSQRWIDETLRGRLMAVWRAMLPFRPGLTLDDAAVLWGQRELELEQAADLVAELSAPTLGNGPPLQTVGAQTQAT